MKPLKQYPYKIQNFPTNVQCSFWRSAVFLSENYSVPVQPCSISFKTLDSCTICSVWLTLNIAVKMCNGRYAVQHSLKTKHCCWRKMLLVTICLEDNMVPQEKNTILARTLKAWKDEIHLNEVQPYSHLSCMTILLRKDLTPWNKFPWRQRIPLNRRQYSCVKIPCVGRCNRP